MSFLDKYLKYKNKYLNLKNSINIGGADKIGSDKIKILILAGPSGVGKDSIIDKLKEKFPGQFEKNVSYTSRPRRDKEVDGVSYHYTTKEHMLEMLRNDQFLEFVGGGDKFYGTVKDSIRSFPQGILIYNINMDGLEKYKEYADKNPDLDVKYIFIDPPSLGALCLRLVGRESEATAEIKRRLETGSKEISQVEQVNYVTRIVNDDINRCIMQIIEHLGNWIR